MKLEEYKAKQEEKKRNQEISQAAAKEILEVEVLEILKSCPAIKKLKWSQYAPYFNDGDACEFGVNDIEFLFEGEEELGEEEWGGYDEQTAYKYLYGDEINSKAGEDSYKATRRRECTAKLLAHPEWGDTVKAVNKIINLFGSIAEEDMKGIYGENSEIIVSKDGFEINDDFSHD